MSKAISFSFVVLSFTLMSLTAQAAQPLPTEAMYTVDSIPLPAGLTMDAVKRGVRKSLFIKDWQMREVSPGQIQAQFKKGDKYMLSVDVKYDTKSVSIAYKDSVGLNYSSSGEIHKTYNERIRDLEKLMRAELDAF